MYQIRLLVALESEIILFEGLGASDLALTPIGLFTPGLGPDIFQLKRCIANKCSTQQRRIADVLQVKAMYR